MKPLTIALPKGRLLSVVLDYLDKKGLKIDFAQHQLSSQDSTGRLKAYKVKNHDLPAYLYHGITGLGVAGDDSFAESGHTFTRILDFPFGATRLCMAAPQGTPPPEESSVPVVVATSYPKITRNWFHNQGIPVKIIKLNGSVELAPLLKLAPYITDLVETGRTLEANGLEIIREMLPIKVRLVANPAYFKLYYAAIQKLADDLEEVL